MKDNWMAEEEHWRGIRIVISDIQGTACLEALCSIATGTSPDCLGCFPFHEFCFWQILILFWWSSQYPHKPLSETFQLRPYKMWEKYKPVKCLEEIWGAQGCLNPSAVCIYSTQKDFSSSDDTTLGLLCSWLPADSSTINVLVPRYLRYTLFPHASWSSRAVLKKKRKNLNLNFLSVQKLGYSFDITYSFLFCVYVSANQMIWPNKRCHISCADPACLLLITFTAVSSEFVLNRSSNLCSKCCPCINHTSSWLLQVFYGPPKSLPSKLRD